MPTSDSTGSRSPVSARHPIAAVSWFIGAAAVTTFFAIGAWQRRWIADDGLIVLRTLRNLFAGNGPVFNAGERVEANTSTAWTYLLWFWAWVTGGQLEYVALWVALLCSVVAVPLAMYGTARLYWPSLSRVSAGATLLLPLGAIIYIALPPARDFATSGLENGLCLIWIAALWVQALAWGRRGGLARSGRRVGADLALAFTAGLAPLIRPELTIIGGLVLLLVFFAPQRWITRVAIVVVAGALPVIYQIFRMGYYAVLVPNPAIAKDASGSKWKQGFIYLSNMFGPYTLLLPTILAIVAALMLLVSRRVRANNAAAHVDSSELDWTPDDEPAVDTSLRGRWSTFSGRLQTPSVVVGVIFVAGLIDALYWLRQGGDFMHARVLLVPLFTMLLPVMVVPLTIPAHLRAAVTSGGTGVERARSRQVRWQLGGAVLMLAMWITTLVWAINSHENTLPNNGIDIGRSGIVDERRFYVTNMGNENPVTAADYLDYPRMRAMVEKIDEYKAAGGVLLPSGNYDEWYIAQMPTKMAPGVPREVTVFFLNLGMTSMNAPLDVRVVDQMGLAYPIAAHTARLEDGRIGHDKVLQAEWVVAESGAFPRRPTLPGFLDEDTVRQAQVALSCPATQDRLASYKQLPWTFARFKSSLKQSFGFSTYRIQRNPEYEIQRCGLVMPERINPR